MQDLEKDSLDLYGHYDNVTFNKLVDQTKTFDDDNWLSTSLHSQTDTETVLKSPNEEDTIFSRGMSAEATSAATAAGAIFGITSGDANYGTTELVDASVYGLEGRFKFGSDSASFTDADGTTYTDPGGTPMFGTSDDVGTK